MKGANVANLEVVISPDYKTAGEYSFSVFATDAYNQEASSIINYTVEHANRAPEALPIADVTLAVGACNQLCRLLRRSRWRRCYLRYQAFCREYREELRG